MIIFISLNDNISEQIIDYVFNYLQWLSVKIQTVKVVVI